MNLKAVDINCDTGEGIGNEPQLLPLISRCNIACGGHTGDEKTITEVLKLCKKYGVKAGAHPSYPDKLNFGRKVISMSPEILERSITDQLLLFKKCTDEEKVEVTHIKPHGALYNEAVKNRVIAAVIVKTALQVFPGAAILAPYRSELAIQASQKGVQVLFEVFGDRNYNDDLSLVSRALPDALIHEPEKVFSHMLHILKNSEVRTLKNKSVPVKAQSFCIHGDTENAQKILTFIKNRLPDHGWTVSL